MSITDTDITLTPVGSTNAITVNTNNVGALIQKDGFNVMSNIAYYDSADTLFIGSSTDSGRGSIMTLMPINIFKRHVVWDFNEAAIPAGLTYSIIGHASYDFNNQDSRININTGNVSAGDGASLTGNNLYTTTSRRTRVYFTLNEVTEDRNTDIQFGVRDGGNNVIRFRYAAASNAHSSVVGTVANGGSTNTQTIANANILDRRVYMLQWDPSGDIHFYYGDTNNVLQLGATVAANDASVPSSSAKLFPFVQFRTNDAAAVRTLNLDTIYFITEW